MILDSGEAEGIGIMSENEQHLSNSDIEQSRFVDVHLIKGANFRVIHADGVWFGASPYGDVHLTFYNERVAIPTKLVMRIDQTGHVDEDQSKRESKTGFVREMEVDIVLSPHSALAFYEALTKNLPAIQEATKSQSRS